MVLEQLLNKLDDNECIRLYRETGNNIYVEVLLVRYERIISNTSYKIYNNYRDRYSYEDVYQEVRMYMIKIINLFNLEKGFKFMTYMYKSIKLGSSRFIKQDKFYPCHKDMRTRFNPISLVGDLKLDVDNFCNNNGEKLIDDDTYLSLIDNMINGYDDEELIDDHIIYSSVLESMKHLLTDDERYIVEQYYIKDKNQMQIATMLNVNQTLVSRTLNRSRNKLKAYWNKD